MSDSKKHPAVGIDLGTTFSAVAYLDSSGRPETIRSAEGDLTTPSAVFFDRKCPIIGIEAVEAGLLEPERLALYAKRDVGEDEYEKQIRGESFPPEVIQALILQKLKSDAELKLGDVTKAVVTVPAFFNEPCRKATQDAGRLAGLEVLDIINEPTAAAITYGVEQGFLNAEGKSEKLERVLVYDLGGGTFDVTVMEIHEGSYKTIATAGDVYLGGIDWDRRIVDFIADEFQKEHGIDPREDPRGEQELVRKANQTKHALTQRESVSIAFAFDGNRLRTELTQEQFAKQTEDLVERTLMTVRLVLDDAKLDWPDLTRLILVGGSTRMPMIRDELTKHSGFELDRSLSPDEAVSHGAALYAGMLLGHSSDNYAKVSVTNVNSHDLGILAVDPKTSEPRRQIMIPRNSRLPAQSQVRFRTHQDNQTNVKIEVVEGGDDRGTNATKIGKCLVNDLPPNTPKGTSVDVVFHYSQDGRLTVSANLPDVERHVKMLMDRAAGLSEEQLAFWRKRIEEGLIDPEVPELVIDDDPDELLPDDDTTDGSGAFAIVTGDAKPGGAKSTPKPSVKPNPAAKPKPTLKKLSPVINTGDAETAPKKTPSASKPAAKPVVAKADAKKPVLKKASAGSAPKVKITPKKTGGTLGVAPIGVAPTGKAPVTPTPPKASPEKKPLKKPPAKKLLKKPVVAKTDATPKLDIGDAGSAPKVSAKPGEPNFSQLMGLGGAAPKKKAAGEKPPSIIATDGAGSSKKKKAGWKSRGKKLSTDQDQE